MLPIFLDSINKSYKNKLSKHVFHANSKHKYLFVFLDNKFLLAKLCL